MSQGKAWNKEEVIRTLEPYFKLGCNVKKACAYAGMPYTTVATWVQNDEELSIKITSWQNEMNAKARKVLKEAMDKDDKGVALEWIKRKEKDEFSDRTETDITSKGESVTTIDPKAIALAKEYEAKLKQGL